MPPNSQFFRIAQAIRTRHLPKFLDTGGRATRPGVLKYNLGKQFPGYERTVEDIVDQWVSDGELDKIRREAKAAPTVSALGTSDTVVEKQTASSEDGRQAPILSTIGKMLSKVWNPEPGEQAADKTDGTETKEPSKESAEDSVETTTSSVTDSVSGSSTAPQTEDLRKLLRVLATDGKLLLEQLEQYDGGNSKSQENALVTGKLGLLSTALKDRLGDLVLSPNNIEGAVLFPPKLLRECSDLLPEHALVGCRRFPDRNADSEDRVFLNTNVAWSAFLCGLQGSGKSHSVSCLLENSLISYDELGTLRRPSAALVLNYTSFSSAASFQPCEAAYLALPSPNHRGKFAPIDVTVLAEPSNLLNLQKAYSKIPGITVKPFRFHPSQLNIASMQSLMGFEKGNGSGASSSSLYMRQVTSLLRKMNRPGEFQYSKFKDGLKMLDLNHSQQSLLNQRIASMESFLDLTGNPEGFRFPRGSLTIVDLSSPFVDENWAALLFNICLQIFNDSAPKGSVVAVDEAHRYLGLTRSPSSKLLTETLLTRQREQRHKGNRTIISTQEPTIDPRLIELSSMTFIHRFHSPAWFSAIKNHLSVGRKEDSSKVDHELFSKITQLGTGDALAFAPTAVMDYGKGLRMAGSKLLELRVRERVTWDV